ncbi:MAG TPA: TCR/Tet family MFS transporter [Stenotrophobium sp.]|nr:TCR/Tet family MFS transporter [Stenotrophobium sp.]
MTPTPASGAARPAAVTFIFITVLLDMLAFGIVIPVLPKLVEQFFNGDTVHAARFYGLFGATWALMQFIFSPLQGALSDRFGRRPVILLSCFGLGADYLFMALAPTVGWLLLGRAISGITSASNSTAAAYIADVTPPDKRARAYGLLGAAFGVGFILGPAIGGVLGNINPRLPFWFAGGLALLNASYGLFVLPESLPPERRARRFDWMRANPVGSLRLLRSHPELFSLAGVNLLFQFAHFVLPSTFVLYAGYRFHWDARTMGMTFALIGACSIVVQTALVKPAVAHLGERGALLAGLLFCALGYAAMGLAPNGTLLILAMPVFALSGLFRPSLQALMARRVAQNEQGQLHGANFSLMGLAGMVAPALFTQTFAGCIAPGSDIHLPGAPFLLAAILTALALLLAWRFADSRETQAA